MDWTKKRKIIAAALATALAAGVAIVGVVVPSGESGDNPAVIAYSIGGGYSVHAELPLIVRFMPQEVCEEAGNCDELIATTLPIDQAHPMTPNSSLWLRVFVHNTASVTVPGVSGTFHWIDEEGVPFDGLGDIGEVVDAYPDGVIPEPTWIAPGTEVERWIHIKVPELPAPGTRSFIITFTHDLEN